MAQSTWTGAPLTSFDLEAAFKHYFGNTNRHEEWIEPGQLQMQAKHDVVQSLLAALKSSEAQMWWVTCLCTPMQGHRRAVRLASKRHHPPLLQEQNLPLLLPLVRKLSPPRTGPPTLYPTRSQNKTCSH